MKLDNAAVKASFEELGEKTALGAAREAEHPKRGKHIVFENVPNVEFYRLRDGGLNIAVAGADGRAEWVKTLDDSGRQTFADDKPGILAAVKRGLNTAGPKGLADATLVADISRLEKWPIDLGAQSKPFTFAVLKERFEDEALDNSINHPVKDPRPGADGKFLHAHEKWGNDIKGEDPCIDAIDHLKRLCAKHAHDIKSKDQVPVAVIADFMQDNATIAHNPTSTDLAVANALISNVTISTIIPETLRDEAQLLLSARVENGSKINAFRQNGASTTVEVPQAALAAAVKQVQKATMTV